MSTSLTPQAVRTLLTQCVASTETKGTKLVQMFSHNYALNVSGREEEIRNMLAELPEIFFVVGHSMIGAVFDRDGAAWTHQLVDAQHLLALGVAANIVSETFPPIMRQSLPEGVPYYTIEPW